MGAIPTDGDTAVSFNGSGSYATVGYASALNGGAFSVEAWAYPTGGAGAYRGVLASRAYPAGWVLYAGKDDAWQFQIGDDAEVPPRAAKGQLESGDDLVEDEERALGVGEVPNLLGLYYGCVTGGSPSGGGDRGGVWLCSYATRRVL